MTLEGGVAKKFFTVRRQDKAGSFSGWLFYIIFYTLTLVHDKAIITQNCLQQVLSQLPE